MRTSQTLEEYVQRHFLSSTLAWEQEDVETIDTRGVQDKTASMTRSIRVPISILHCHDTVDMEHILHLAFPSEADYIHRAYDEYGDSGWTMETRTERTIRGRIIRMDTEAAQEGDEREEACYYDMELQEDAAVRQIRAMERETLEKARDRRTTVRLDAETQEHSASPLVTNSNVQDTQVTECRNQIKSPALETEQVTNEYQHKSDGQDDCGRESLDDCSGITSLPQRFEFTKEISFQSIQRESDDTSIKSFSSTYSVESSASIMKLKARKRMLERLASQPRMLVLQPLAVN